MDEAFDARVRAAVAKGASKPEEDIKFDVTLAESGLQSLDMIMIIFALEDEFKISIAQEDFAFAQTPQYLDTHTLNDLIREAKPLVQRLASATPSPPAAA